MSGVLNKNVKKITQKKRLKYYKYIIGQQVKVTKRQFHFFRFLKNLWILLTYKRKFSRIYRMNVNGARESKAERGRETQEKEKQK